MFANAGSHGTDPVSRAVLRHLLARGTLSRPVALEQIRSQITRGANVVHDAAERLRDGLEAQRVRQQLEGELDSLFAELGVEVYQRFRRGDPIEGSVVIEDLVDRIAEVEKRLETATDPA